MLTAVSGSIRIGRRRFQCSLLPLRSRQQSTATLDLYVQKQHDAGLEPEHVEPPNYKPQLSQTPPFPFYSLSYAPEASTSKLPSQDAPLETQAKCAATPPLDLSKRQKRLNRYLRAVTRLINNLPRSHKAPHAQISLVVAYLLKLKDALGAIDGGSKRLAPADIHALIQAVSIWIDCGTLARTPSVPFLCSFTRLHLYLISTLLQATVQRTPSTQSLHKSSSTARRDEAGSMQHALPAARRQVEQLTRTERRRFLDSLASQLPTTALLQVLHATTIEDWLSLGPVMLDRLTTAVLTGTATCANLHAALPCHSSLARYRISPHTRVHELHEYLYSQQLSNEQIPSRMFGPAPSKAPSFNGLKALLSSTVLSEDLLSTSKTDFSHRFQQAIKLLQRFRQEHLPPDRQVMAALLQLGNLAPSESLVNLEESDIFGWLWREWTVLRENEPDLVADDVLLVGFLEIAGKLVSQKGNTIRPQVDEEISTPVWIRQAYQMGITKADVRYETGLSSTHYHIEQDQPPETNLRLLRALAVAAIHLDRYETAFTCLLDHRMRPKHIIPVLYALCGRVDAFERIDPDMAHKLVLACAEYLPSLTPRVPRSFSPKHAKELSAFVVMLVRNDCMPAAGAFMKIPSSPLRLGEAALLTICRLLTRQTGSQLLEQIYRSLPSSSWTPRLLEVFLSSADFPLSKEIWTYVRTRQDFGERRFLDARLRHHLRQPILRYRTCMKDFERTVRDLDVQPNASTLLLYLDVHIRAGCGFRARYLYNELASLEDPPKGLETRFLQLAGLPAWPQYRRRGASSQMMRLGAHLDQLTAKGASLDAMSAQYVVRQSLRWAELNNEAIWAILKSGVSNASNLNWHRDLRPLFTAVKAAFKRRGEHEALQEVEEMEIRVRKEAIIRSRKAS